MGELDAGSLPKYLGVRIREDCLEEEALSGGRFGGRQAGRMVRGRW